MTYVLITDETERILKQRSGKEGVNAGISWLLDHAEARGQEITWLQKENEDLKTKLIGKGNTVIFNEREIEELKGRVSELEGIIEKQSNKIISSRQENEELKTEINDLKLKLIGKGNTIIIQVKEIEELKESIRSITAMDKEDPCERVEKLLGDVQDLTARNRKLEDENESIHEELLIEKQRMSMLSASFEMLEYQKNVLEGEVKQANVTLQMLRK